MRNRIALASGITLIAASAAFATNARVVAMGKNSTYFMDDVSVWSNPANANLYPNYLLGELGQVPQRDPSDTNNYKAFARYNRDPINPWFGAIFAKSFSPDAAAGNRYPQVVIGGAFNRDDEWLQYFPTHVKLKSAPNAAKAYDLSLPVKFDGILGGATSSGLLLGVKTYLAYGDSTQASVSVTPLVSVNTLGLNMPLGQGVDLEATGTVSFLDAKITDANLSYGGNFDPSFGASVRAFITAPQIYGVIVPAASFRSISSPWLERTEFRIGSGANVSLDRGFFWLGVDYFRNSQDKNQDTQLDSGTVNDTAKITSITENGLRVSFGIERNIWTDWFVVRVGGQKIIASQDWTGPSANHSEVVTNPEGDNEATDLVSFGFGLNIEDKLKIDVVMAKDLLFTGGALLSGPTDHILSRISASYSF